MTAIATARETIYEAFVSGTALDPDTQVVFENEKFSAPVDTPWARLTVSHEAGEQDTLGPIGERNFLRRGRVLIQLYTSVDIGVAALDALAHATRNIFEGVTLTGGLCFTSVDIRETGSDGEWFQFIVDAPFEYRETK